MNDSLDSQGMVYIPVPVPFLDSDGKEWTLERRNGVDNTLSLYEVLLLTLRKCPVKSGLDAMRVLDIREAIKRCWGEPSIALAQSDFEWMVVHFGEFAHTVWVAPEAAFLVRFLMTSKKTKPAQKQS